MTRIAFGDFSLDMYAGDLRRGDNTIDLRPKIHLLLMYLVRNAGRLISKEELLSAVWPETHVADGSLNRAITELRDALGDDAENPTFIETVPRRGYRFIAPVANAASPNNPRRVSRFLVTHRDRQLPLFEGENVIGRTPECEVQLPFGSVSRRHARILVEDRLFLEDLGSTNGTFLSDRKIAGQTELQPGDEIRIGSEKLRVLNEAMLQAPTDRLV